MALSSEEPYGTTPLPTSQSGSPVRVSFDADAVLPQAQQPQTQQIAVFESKGNSELNGNVIDVSQHFVVYAVKNGLIRVLHRHSTLKTLLRVHKDQDVTDISFFQDGDVLATVGSNEKGSTVRIWRVFERSPHIMAETLLELESTHMNIRRVVWHPFNPNQFWMLHYNPLGKRIATLVETTRITTTMAEHAVCQLHTDYIVMDGAVQLSHANVTDLAWSHVDTRHVVTSHDDGSVLLWDLKQLQANEDGTVTPAVLQRVTAPQSNVSRVRWLPHEDVAEPNNNSSSPWKTPCFLTASDNNSTFTLWSPFAASGLPQPRQVVALENPASSYVLQVCFGPAPPDASPPSCFVVMADRTAGKIFAFHVQAAWASNSQDATSGDNNTKLALLVGCDYVVPFRTKFPTYSWSVSCQPTTDISVEDLQEQGGLIFDVKIVAYQSTVVQSLTLTSYMCLPPENSWTDPTPGVRVERLLQVHSAHVSEIASEDNVHFEEYEVEVDDEEEDEVEAPEPSALPPPEGLDETKEAAPLSSNPFANWLGAIASKTPTRNGPSSSTPPPPAPEAPPASALPPPGLSPLDILSGKSKEEARTLTPVMGNRSPGGQPKATVPDGAPQVPVRRPTAVPALAQSQEAAPGVPGRQSSVMNVVTNSHDTTPLSPRRRSTLIQLPPGVSSSGTDLQELVEVAEVDIAMEIGEAIQEQMQTSVLPALQTTIQESLDKSVTNPIKSSIGKLAKSGVNVDNDKLASALSESIDEPLRASFADCMKTVLIPSLESMTGQILSQVSERLEKSAPAQAGTQQAIESMATQISTLTTLVTKLSSEVQALRASVDSKQAASVPPPPSVPIQQPADIRGEILSLLKTKNYEAAFTKAVSSRTTDMTAFCCANADLQDVLGGSAPKLSQPILLCLVQQLGTILSLNMESNLQTELEWLQEIALSLNPSDPSIHRHVAGVLQQLVVNINSRMQKGEPALRRPLQRLLQVIRGMQIG